MTASSGMELEGIYYLPSYPNEDSVHIRDINPPVISLYDVMSNYPYLNTIHDVAVAASSTSDLGAISYLVSHAGYLPIRWQMVYDKAGDSAVKDMICSNKRCFTVPDLPRIPVHLDDSNYTVLLDRSIHTGDIELMERILSHFGDKRDLLYPYKHASIPVVSRKYLIERGYLEVDDRTRCIVADDPSCITSLTPSEIRTVVMYDSVSIYSSAVKDVTSTTGVYGKILSYILSVTRSSSTIDSLVSMATYEDLKMLTTRDISESSVYKEICKRGYFELLGNMRERDLLLLVTSASYNYADEETIEYVEYRYPLVFTEEDILEGAVVNANVDLLDTLIHPGNVRLAISLSYQYHMWDASVLAILIQSIDFMDVTSIPKWSPS